MIDGRSIYNPTISGVYWDIQSPLLADIERIEVVRGPGAVVWGLNAVNGVINIVTKNSQSTVGSLMQIGGGTEERVMGALRSGWQMDDYSTLRASASFHGRDGLERAGVNEQDDWYVGRVAFRADHNPDNDVVSLLTDYVWTSADSIIYENAPGDTLPTSASSFDIVGRWSRNLENDANLTVQFYYDHIERDGFLGEVQRRDTFDLDVVHNTPLGEMHNLVWGLNARLISDEVGLSETVKFDPKQEDVIISNVFVQDELSLLDERLHLFWGTKLSDNEFTGLEWQPGLRVSFKAGSDTLFWFGVSKAKRLPARFERDGSLRLPEGISGVSGLGIVPVVQASRELKAENVVAWESGVRGSSWANINWDLALFYNKYSNVTSQTPGMPQLGLNEVVLPLMLGQNAAVSTLGGEICLDWKFSERWKSSLVYSYLSQHIDRPPNVSALVGDSPSNIATWRNSFELYASANLDAVLRYVDAYADPGVGPGSYVTADLSMTLPLTEELSLLVVGQNLLRSGTKEYGQILIDTPSAEVQRGGYVRLSWLFNRAGKW